MAIYLTSSGVCERCGRDVDSHLPPFGRWLGCLRDAVIGADVVREQRVAALGEAQADVRRRQRLAELERRIAGALGWS
jgi:hypothetical protein